MTELSIVINAPINVVWDFIADINTHPSWMKDAVSIKRLNDKDNQIGAKYLCKTTVGPLRTDDLMEVTQYEKPNLIEIHHIGAVKGPGRFELKAIDPSTTKFSWIEELTFPLYMGAGFGKFFAMKLLHQIWKKNLVELKKAIEKGETN